MAKKAKGTVTADVPAVIAPAVAVTAAVGTTATTTEVLGPKQRQAMARRLSPAGQRVVEEGATIFARFSGSMLYYQLKIGQLLHGYNSDPDLTPDQKADELASIALIWNQPKFEHRCLYDFINVAEAFSIDELVELELLIRPDSKSMPQARQMSNGQYVTWSHLVELQKIDEKRRKGLIQKMLKNSWSANELRLNVQGERLAVNHRAGGRLPGVPKNPVALVRKLQLTVQHSRRYMDAVAQPLETTILEAEGELTPALLNEIDAALQQLAEAEETAKQTRQRLMRVKAKASGGASAGETTSSSKRKAKPVEESEPSEDFDTAVVPTSAATSGFDVSDADDFEDDNDAGSDDFEVDSDVTDDEDFTDADVTVDDEFDE